MIRRLLIVIAVVAGGLAVSYVVNERRPDPPPRPFVDPVIRTALAPFCTGEPDGKKHRVLVIGLDGADFRYIDPLMAAGKMPNLQALVNRGVCGRLESTIIPISSAAWTSVVTGTSPARSGIFSFFQTVPGSYDVELISSLDRKTPPVWRILNHYGRKVIVFGMPVTYPVEAVDGIMVAGMLAPEQADYAWPPGLAAALRGVGFVPDLGIWREERPLNRNVLYNQLEIKRHALTALLTGNDWDAAFVVFKSLDVLKHRGTTGELRARIDELYLYLDRMIGTLVRLAGEETDILVISDHGFTSYATTMNLNGWLVAKGFARLDEENAGAIYDNTGPLAEARASSHAFEMSLIDIPHSAAITGPAEGNFGSIRVNLSGREPRGAVAPGALDRVVDAILDSLRAAVDPVHGGALVRRAFRTGELYQGPFLGALPDILFEVDGRIIVRPFTRLPSIQPLAVPYSDHELDGIFLAAGPSFRTSPERVRASVLDITPTLLHLLGLPVYRGMDGEVLSDLLTTGEPVLYEDEPPGLRGPAGLESFTAEQREELEKRLKALSYTR